MLAILLLVGLVVGYFALCEYCDHLVSDFIEQVL
jgi:hypothetical protein